MRTDELTARDLSDIGVTVGIWGVAVVAIVAIVQGEHYMPSCSQEQRELVCRSKCFGPVDPYTKKLNSAEYKGQLIDGSVQNTINAYGPGGQCWGTDNGYWNSHASPQNYGWSWKNNTWNPPAEPGPPPGENMMWNGKNFV